MLNTILFDLDGTLIDTEPTAAAVVKKVFQNWGITITPQDASYVTGRTWASALDYLYQKYAVPVARNEASEEVLRKYGEALDVELPLVPGGIDAVRAVATSGEYKLGLVTGSGQREVYRSLDKMGIRGLFTVILCAEDYPRSKPAPDGYLKAMAMLDSKPSETLIFEDSQAGIASARQAGCWVVAISSTNHFHHDTSAAHDSIVDLRGVDGTWVRAFERARAVVKP